jgi:hypothetical protein
MAKSDTTPKTVLVLNQSAQSIHAAYPTGKSTPGAPAKQKLVTTVPGPNAVPAEHAHLFEINPHCDIGDVAAAKWQYEAPRLIAGALSTQGLMFVLASETREDVKVAIERRLAQLDSNRAQ